MTGRQRDRALYVVVTRGREVRKLPVDMLGSFSPMYQPWAYSMRAKKRASNTAVPIQRYALNGVDLSR